MNIATELSSDQDTISRPLKQGNESVAAMRAEYQVEHTHHQHSSPKVVMGGAEQTKSQGTYWIHAYYYKHVCYVVHVEWDITLAKL